MDSRENKIYSYLHAGYDMSHFNELPPPPPLTYCEFSNPAYNANEAAELLDKVYDEIFSVFSGFKYCVIPISGGWDSRILLGAALERLDRGQIKTYTYGVPGQLDYSIGKQIAKRFSVKHYAINLSEIRLNWDELLKSVVISPWTFVPDAFINHLSLSYVAQAGDIVLSGFMGGSISGVHSISAETLKDVKDEFLKKQRRQRVIRLLPDGYDIGSVLPECKEYAGIPYCNVLDLGIRQSNGIASIVTPQKRWIQWGVDMGIDECGARVIAPYCHPAWASYWLKAPPELLSGQLLYKEMLEYKFKKLSKIPSTHYLTFSKRLKRKLKFYLHKFFPRIIHMPVPLTSKYADFRTAFQERNDYKTVLDTAFDYLRKHNIVPWLNLPELKACHMDNKADYSGAFLILIGLALNLQNEQ
jgi:hypothetical protein